MSVSCQADNLVTRVRVLFDYDHARRDRRQAVELIAREAEARHGRQDATLAGVLQPPALARRTHTNYE